MAGVMQKRRYIPLADERVKGKSGRRVWPAAKAFTLPRRERVVLAANEKPQHGVRQPMPPKEKT